MEITNTDYVSTETNGVTVAPTLANPSGVTPANMMGANMVPTTAGQKSQKHAERQEKAKNYNHNIKTLSSGRNLNYQTDSNTFLATYFQNLVAGNLDVIKAAYFGRSMLTFTHTTAEGVNRQDFQGADAIIGHLNVMKSHVGYNIVETIIQPGLGQGSTILLRGTLNEFQMTMVINLVKIAKQYHILNQLFTIV